MLSEDTLGFWGGEPADKLGGRVPGPGIRAGSGVLIRGNVLDRQGGDLLALALEGGSVGGVETLASSERLCSSIGVSAFFSASWASVPHGTSGAQMATRAPVARSSRDLICALGFSVTARTSWLVATTRGSSRSLTVLNSGSCRALSMFFSSAEMKASAGEPCSI